MFASKESKITVPKRSEILGGWVLPFLSQAFEEQEKEEEALEMFRSVERLKARQHGDK